MIFWSLIIFQVLLLIAGFTILGRLLYIFVTFHRQKVPYVPIPRHIVKRLVDVAEIPPDIDLKMIDLGSGTGKMALRLARLTGNQVKIYGVEKSLLLHFFAKIKWAVSLDKSRIKLFTGDWNNISLNNYDYVFVFLTNIGMELLLPKFAAELRTNAKIISYIFPLPHNNIFNEKKITWGKNEKIFVYERKSY